MLAKGFSEVLLFSISKTYAHHRLFSLMIVRGHKSLSNTTTKEHQHTVFYIDLKPTFRKQSVNDAASNKP